MGLEGPEPLARLYNRNFFRASWFLIALDAGFWTAMPIRPKFLRDILSIWFSIFYLFFPEQAENKVRKFRATVTVEAMRVSWEKQTNPYFSLISMLSRPWFGVKKRILIPRPSRDAYDDEPIAAHIYFTGAAKDFTACKSIILSIPGGGFVSMPPVCHESYFSLWCKDTNVPIISLDYKKAPEYPYPYAINECFDAYRTIIETKGRCLGLDGLKVSTIRSTLDNQKHHTEVPIALVGDSAGGNLATSLMYKILEWHRQPLARPQGIILIYPCLNFNISSWMSTGQIKMFRSQSVKTLEALWESKSHYKHKSPLSTFSDTEGSWRTHYPSIEEQVHRQSYGERLNELARLRPSSENEAPKPTKLHRREPSREQIPARNKHSQLTMTSRMTFFNDRVLTPDLMRVMAILYIGPHNQPDFHNDYYLSPIVGPENLLAQFPKTYLICGEKDPFVDDTILFAGRIRQAKMRVQRRSSSVALNQNRNRGEGASLFALTPLVDSKNESQKNKTSTFVIGDENSDVFSNESSDTESPPPSKVNIGTSNNDSEFLTTGESLLLPVESYTRLYPANSSLNLNAPQSASASGGICEEQLGVEVRLLSGMSHAFLSMIPFLPEAVSSTKYIASWFLDILCTNEDLPEDTD